MVMTEAQAQDPLDLDEDGEFVTEADLEPEFETVVIDVPPAVVPKSVRYSYVAPRREPPPLPRSTGAKGEALRSRRGADSPPVLASAVDGVGVGSVLCGRYRVEGVVRRGGPLLTLRVFHTELHETMLFTCVAPSALTRPEVVGGFLRSARGALQIRDEHVARITDVGRLPNGAPFMVAEHSGGTSLADVVRVRGALPVAEAVDHVMQITHAVAEAHSLDLVHGALTPSCIELVRRADGSPLIKVSGFGALPTVDELLHDDDTVFERRTLRELLPYVAPERLRRPESADRRSDVYTIGALLYELVTGHAPFRGASPAALLAMVVADVAAPPSALRAGVPIELDGVVARCLEKEPNRRYGSVGDLALALRPLAAPETQHLADRVVRVVALPSARPSGAPLVLAGRSVRTGSTSPPTPVVEKASRGRPGFLLLAAVGAGVAAGALCAGVALAFVLQTGVAPPLSLVGGGSPPGTTAARAAKATTAVRAPDSSGNASSGRPESLASSVLATAAGSAREGPRGEATTSQRLALARRWWNERPHGVPSRPADGLEPPARTEDARRERGAPGRADADPVNGFAGQPRGDELFESPQ
ncbi:MAG: serine/threonine protein kinase [Polyangiaceae bacterium]|nr:serine/threonine protein kinase [Polyangiaceae bacterium]